VLVSLRGTVVGLGVALVGLFALTNHAAAAGPAPHRRKANRASSSVVVRVAKPEHPVIADPKSSSTKPLPRPSVPVLARPVAPTVSRSATQNLPQSTNPRGPDVASLPGNDTRLDRRDSDNQSPDRVGRLIPPRILEGNPNAVSPRLDRRDRSILIHPTHQLPPIGLRSAEPARSKWHCRK
jgi:hypothetical protein